MDAAKDANSNLKIEMARIGGWNLKVQLRLSSHSAQKIIELYLIIENSYAFLTKKCLMIKIFINFEKNDLFVFLAFW